MSIKPLFTDSELLGKVARGDQRAFRILYNQYRDKVYTQCIRLLKSEPLAEETLQEIFLKLWRMEDELYDILHLDAYLKKLTRNRCLNVLRSIIRSTKREEEYTKDFQDYDNETEESIILNDTRNSLNQAISLLPTQQREVYILCHQEGLKYEEAAQRLNISPLTVKTHMQRALKFLRSYLKDHHDLAAILILLKLF